MTGEDQKIEENNNLKKIDFSLELTCVHFKGDFLANLGQKTVKHKWSTYFKTNGN